MHIFRSTIGKRRNRLTLQRPTRSRSSRGTPTLVPADVATVFGRVRKLGARELVTASQMQATTTHEVVIQYRSDLTAAWQIKWLGRWGTRYLAIDSIDDPEEAHVELVIRCTEKTE